MSENRQHQEQKRHQEEMERAYYDEMAKQEQDYYASLEIHKDIGLCLV